MDKNVKEILNIIEDNKEKLTTQEYMTIMSSLMEINKKKIIKEKILDQVEFFYQYTTPNYKQNGIPIQRLEHLTDTINDLL
jgi:hypothetical protein